ncbi:hypothetical protein GCM10009557_42550 [Virgisporangium ochraceum]|uniref:Uncharacterized protein n=1 Tax=Virgisporangium ochraceum TaxID=65505 RepID=A0A8J4A7F9_9ACTN|nr:hypothetical protein Voc01_102020 [Virgisporangium ochraceum]
MWAWLGLLTMVSVAQAHGTIGHVDRGRSLMVEPIPARQSRPGSHRSNVTGVLTSPSGRRAATQA